MFRKLPEDKRIKIHDYFKVKIKSGILEENLLKVPGDTFLLNLEKAIPDQKTFAQYLEGIVPKSEIKKCLNALKQRDFQAKNNKVSVNFSFAVWLKLKNFKDAKKNITYDKAVSQLLADHNELAETANKKLSVKEKSEILHFLRIASEAVKYNDESGDNNLSAKKLSMSNDRKKILFSAIKKLDNNL